MYAAIAGLQTHMQKMNVIGNNIANANTYGFKPGSTVFGETLYTANRNSTAGGAQYGGTNASQIGYGSKLASIDLNMGTGSYTPTGLNSDVYINGGGFLMVGPKPTDLQSGFASDPNDLLLTRVGRLAIDSDGYLVDGNGRCVYGFMPQGAEDTGAILMDGDDIQWDNFLRPIRVPAAVPEPEGNQGTQPPTGNTATTAQPGDAYYPTLENTGDLTYGDGMGADSARVLYNSATLSVDNSGLVTVTLKDTQKVVTVGVIAIGDVINPNGLTKANEGYFQIGGNSGKVSVGTVGQIVTGNLNTAESGITGVTQDPLTGTGETTLMTGGLEGSKTDVATEFADLITTQRGYQANTKIITVTDEMLAELINMKR